MDAQNEKNCFCLKIISSSLTNNKLLSLLVLDIIEIGGQSLIKRKELKLDIAPVTRTVHLVSTMDIKGKKMTDIESQFNFFSFINNYSISSPTHAE